VNEGGWFRRLVNRSRPAALGLRRRILLIFTLGSLLLSVFLATTTYGLARSSIVAERIDTAISTSQRNAQGVERDLRSLPNQRRHRDVVARTYRRPGLPDLVRRAVDRRRRHVPEPRRPPGAGHPGDRRGHVGEPDRRRSATN
jgi:hypothetical protein